MFELDYSHSFSYRYKTIIYGGHMLFKLDITTVFPLYSHHGKNE